MKTLLLKVSHHPPISAQYVEGRNWTYELTAKSEMRFDTRKLHPYVIFISKSIYSLNFGDSKRRDRYTWIGGPVVYVSLVQGNVECHGSLVISNEVNTCHLKFDGDTVQGLVVNNGNNRIAHILVGSWKSDLRMSEVVAAVGCDYEDAWRQADELAEAHPPDTVLWSGKPYSFGNEHPYKDRPYLMSEFACGLNEPEEEEGEVAPTDSRNRPDQRLMEDGDWDAADELKVVIFTLINLYFSFCSYSPQTWVTHIIVL